MTTCPDCGEQVINEFAHAEECTGINVQRGTVMVPSFSDALVREMIDETQETIRHLDYELAVHRTRLGWLRAVQRGTIKP